MAQCNRNLDNRHVELFPLTPEAWPFRITDRIHRSDLAFTAHLIALLIYLSWGRRCTLPFSFMETLSPRLAHPKLPSVSHSGSGSAFH